MYHIRASCLELIRDLDYDTDITFDQLNDNILRVFSQYSVNSDTAIITYFNKDNVELLLDQIEILPTNGDIFHVFVKKVWDCCSLCLQTFSITDDQLPMECLGKKCGYQYCHKCIKTLRGLDGQPFFCMFCKKQYAKLENGPKRNELIEKYLLWPQFSKKYGSESVTSLGIVLILDNLQSDLECRKAHLLSRSTTLLNKLFKRNVDVNEDMELNEVDQLLQQFELIQNQIQQIFNRMNHNTTVDNCLFEYREILSGNEDCYPSFIHLCQSLINYIEVFDNYSDPSLYQHEVTDYEETKYCVNDVNSLSSEDSLSSIKAILDDIMFRKKCLIPLRETLQLMLTDDLGQHPYTNYLNDEMRKVELMELSIKIIENKIINLHTIFTDINICITNYKNILKDDNNFTVDCSKFIRLCELLHMRIEQLEIEENFPQLTQLTNEWKDIYDNDNEFKPKIIQVLKAVEYDLVNKYGENRQYTPYTIPYKVGIIGCRSVGKSSLHNRLRNIETEYDPLFSPVAIEKSTFCYLQFDKIYSSNTDNNNNQIPISFIDIEGCTDIDSELKSGNYFEEICKVDCDLYLIVFDREFSKLELSWKKYIENTMNRKYLLVRTKVDSLFLDCYQQEFKIQFNNSQIIDEQKIKRILNKCHTIACKTQYNNKLEKVYLTASKYPRCDHLISNAYFSDFDKQQLIDDIIEIAIHDSREERLRKIAVITTAKLINTCFRRGYVVSVMKYKIAAGIASSIPFGDEIPRYFGREKVRQVFGVHNNSYITNKWNKTTNELQTYLMKYKLHILKNDMYTNAFSYLFDRTNTIEKIAVTRDDEGVGVKRKLVRSTYTKKIRMKDGDNNGKILKKIFPLTTSRALIAIGGAADAGIRLAAPTASWGLRVGLSVGLAGVGFVLAIPLCAWAAISNGKQMHNYLHLLCNDLLVLNEYFITTVINQCLQNNDELTADFGASTIESFPNLFELDDDMDCVLINRRQTTN